MDAYAVLRVKTKKTELVYTGESLSLEPRKHSLSDVVELSPEERLALFRLILEVQEKGQSSLKWTVKELAYVCDSNVASIRSLIRKLKGCGLIEPDIVKPTTHGGRTSFIVTRDCRHLLQQSARLEGCPIIALQRRVLLPEDGYNPEKKKRGGFSRSNRWLLAVLLEYSDPLGIVDDLGGAELRSLTGLTKERLRAQILQLKCLGFLHAVSPGISGNPFFGIKPSVYYLNLHHPYFESDRLSGLTILLHSGEINEVNVVPDIDQQKRIQTEVLLKSRQPIATLKSVQLTNFFRNKYLMQSIKLPVSYYLDSVVCRMASHIFSESFGMSGGETDHETTELLNSMISDQPKKEPEGTDWFDFNTQKNTVYQISIMRAAELMRLLLKYSDIDLEELRSYNYTVIPVGYRTGMPRLTFAIEAFPKRKNNKGFKCLSITAGSIASCEQTEELTAEQRYTFGFIDKQMLQKVKALDMPVFDGSSSSDYPET